MALVDLAQGLDAVRPLLLDTTTLVRAIGAGRRRGAEPPHPDRVELRLVDLKGGRVLQAVHRDGPAVRTHHHDLAAAPAAVDALLAQPFASWRVETAGQVLQVRATKRGQASVHREPAAPHDSPAAGAAAPAPDDQGAAGRPAASHDRAKQHLLDAVVEPGDPLFAVLGADGDKRRQVDALLRQLRSALADVPSLDAPLGDGDGDGGDGRPRPLRVVDLGCGNAYLTMAAHRWLAARPGGARTVGVELRADLVARSTERAARAGLDGLSFTAGGIADADPTGDLGGPPDVVLALHACDTATDDALARAVRWGAPVVLAAPCCHHDVQRQLGHGAGAPEPYRALVRSPILRERFADVLTDALRASVLRALGRRVDVVEFVDSRHTPRNALLRVVVSGGDRSWSSRGATGRALAELEALSAAWGVVPALAERLAPELAALRVAPELAVLGAPRPGGDVSASERPREGGCLAAPVDDPVVVHR